MQDEVIMTSVERFGPVNPVKEMAVVAGRCRGQAAKLAVFQEEIIYSYRVRQPIHGLAIQALGKGL
jgi:hypothetical protein